MNKHIIKGHSMSVGGKRLKKCITLMRDRMLLDGRSYFARFRINKLPYQEEKRLKHKWIKICKRKRSFHN